MPRILISFLGKPQQTSTGYRTARYDFGDGRTVTTSFFGLALRDVLMPDRLIVLGTPGSMWDVFVEHQPIGTEAERERLQLMEAVANQTVDEPLLRALEPIVGRALGTECRFGLIPYGRTELEQRRILSVLAAMVGPDDRVVLDLTHGLRHLPLLGFVSALYLQIVRRVSIDALYYGALDLTDADGHTPVLRLDGLWQLTRWLTAVHAFDKDQDYAVFAPMLRACGVSDHAVEALERAAFYERTMRVTEARRPLQEFWRLCPHPLPAPADVIEPLLDKRTAWRDSERLYTRQRDLALFYLENRDYLRSVIFALEGFITYLIQTRVPGSDPQNYDQRHQVKEQYEKACYAAAQTRQAPAADGDDPQWTAYCRLRGIRNTVVHATRPADAEEQAMLQDEARLRTKLEQLYRQLFPEEEP
ncbi:MAG: TIGR02221 family CRISPR-associated protein [Nitrospirae bacterium]|nr:MAG: TIGR02221 family CRISPR-associated protein [Nitrospirota bacterium]